MKQDSFWKKIAHFWWWHDRFRHGVLATLVVLGIVFVVGFLVLFAVLPFGFNIDGPQLAWELVFPPSPTPTFMPRPSVTQTTTPTTEATLVVLQPTETRLPTETAVVVPSVTSSASPQPTSTPTATATKVHHPKPTQTVILPTPKPLDKVIARGGHILLYHRQSKRDQAYCNENGEPSYWISVSLLGYDGFSPFDIAIGESRPTIENKDWIHVEKVSGEFVFASHEAYEVYEDKGGRFRDGSWNGGGEFAFRYNAQWGNHFWITVRLINGSTFVSQELAIPGMNCPTTGW